MATLTTSYQKIGTGGVKTFGASKARIDLYAKYNSQSIPNNNTNWSIEARLVITSGSYIGEYTGTTLTLSGDGISSSQSKGTGNFSNQTLGSASGTTGHNADGTKSVSASASMKFSAWGITLNVSGSATLPTIPRYANITSFSVSKRDETSVTYNYTTNATCDYAWYSTNNGSTWAALPSNKIITGLSANSTYNFKLRVRRQDSQLTTDSGTVQQTTYNYPNCTNSPNFTIGDSLTLTLYNPLKRNVTVSIIGADGTIQGSDTTTGTSITGYNNDNWKNWWYSTIPNATSGKYQVRVTYGSIVKTRNNGNTYSINANDCKPTFENFDYTTDLTDLTGDNDTIINGKTNTTITISSTDKAIGNYSATIQRYSIQCGTQSPKYINYSDDNISTTLNECNSDILKVTAIDSRGLETTITKTVSNFKNYFSPTFMSFNVDRENGIDENVYLDLKLQFWNYNFGIANNTIKQIKYRVKEQGTNNWSNWFVADLTSLVINREEVTLENCLVYSDGISQGFTVGQAYNFQLQVIDGSLNDDLSTIESDVFNLTDGKVAISVLKDNNNDYHVGINGMPDEDFELNITGRVGINGQPLDAASIPQQDDPPSNPQENDLWIDTNEISINYINIYSTNEIKIGTWIDGKPIYRKVYYFSTTDNMNLSLPHNLSNLGNYWINQSASYVYAPSESLPVNWYYSSSDWARTWINSTYIRFRSPSSLGTTRTVYVTVEYTKTTD